jgi:DNA-binding XRE family transcriptional regulator
MGESEQGDLARAIRARRIELEMSVEEAAERARIHVTSWRLIERGTSQPSVLSMRAIGRVLDWTPATVESLMDGELTVDGEGDVVVDLDRWPVQSAEPLTETVDAAPALDVSGLTPEQLAEVQDFIDDLRGDASS